MFTFSTICFTKILKSILSYVIHVVLCSPCFFSHLFFSKNNLQSLNKILNLQQNLQTTKFQTFHTLQVTTIIFNFLQVTKNVSNFVSKFSKFTSYKFFKFSTFQIFTSIFSTFQIFTSYKFLKFCKLPQFYQHQFTSCRFLSICIFIFLNIFENCSIIIVRK